MPSFGYGVIGSPPDSRLVFVSFSQNRTPGAAPSGPALAYVTSAIQYLSSLNAPVSTSSYSGWNLSRDRLTSIRSW